MVVAQPRYGRLNLGEVPRLTHDQSPRIRAIRATPPALLDIAWRDGTRTENDLSAILRAQAWAAPLRDPAVFRKVQVLDDGWRIAWPSVGIELSAQGLWDDVHPRPISSEWMSAAEFTAWMHEMGWSFAQVAGALGVSKRMLKYYAAGDHPIPKPVWLACMHLAAEHARRMQPATSEPA